jgi:hypothetical protein
VEVVFLRGAEADLLAAWMRYEEILPGLGERFEVEVRAALFRTVELPESAPIYAGEFRRLLVRRFDHGIFYCIHGSRISHGRTRSAARSIDDQRAVKPLRYNPRVLVQL